jgi:nucleoside-diphosphate-sugar epimerase
MNFSTNQVLVTGAAGWLGSRLVRALATGLPDYSQLGVPCSGLPIRCLILPGQNATALRNLGNQVEILEGDVRIPADCERFCSGAKDAILFHTAGIIHPRRVVEFQSINVLGCRNVLQAASEAGIARAIVVSSNSPCGCNPHPDHLFDELSPYRPYMQYGRSKMQMEAVAQEFQALGKIDTVIVRPPWFYGPHQPARQILFFSMIRDGKAPIVGSGENLRSMSYVDNLCCGLILAAMSRQASGQVYWIADERPYSMNEIVDTIERLLEREFNHRCLHKRLRLPGLASQVAYGVDLLLQSFGLYHQKIHVLSEMNKTIACSIAKAKRELGYHPVIDLEEGMRRSLRWCVEQGISF